MSLCIIVYVEKLFCSMSGMWFRIRQLWKIYWSCFWKS